MEERIPEAWIGRDILLTVGGLAKGGGALGFPANLVNVNDRGVVVNHQGSPEGFPTFYPWTNVLRIVLHNPDFLPPGWES